MKTVMESIMSTRKSALAALLVMSLPFGVSAQDTGNDGVEIVRDATELRDIIRDHDPDVTNTALLLTNQGGPKSVARCVAFSANGEKIGRAWVRIPANGLRIVLASDVTAGVDFVGSIRCIARGDVVGTAFIVGPGLTDSSVHHSFSWGESRIRAQAVVSY
jgi:hypothetical protein